MIENEFQLQNTRRKLEILEHRYTAEGGQEPSHARDLSLRSLKRMINQFKEEIARFEAGQRAVT